MSFKPILGGWILFALWLSACNWQPGSSFDVGESNPPPGQVNVNLSQFGCLRDIGHRVDDYLNSRLSETQVRQFMECTRSALRRFQVLNKGETYSPLGLAEFLNQVYLKNTEPITPRFVGEIMALKVVILGGSPDLITRPEFEAINQLISKIEDEVVAHLPYIKVYRELPGVNLNEISKPELAKMREQLRATGRTVTGILQAKNKSYSLLSLKNFISELRAFLHWDDLHAEDEKAWNMDQIHSLVGAYKELATGNGNSKINARDWEPLVDTLSTVYGLYLNYRVGMGQRSLMYGEPLDTFIFTVNSALDLVENLANENPEDTISFSTLDRVMTSLEDVKWLPLGLRKESIVSVYKHLIEHGLRNTGEVRRPHAAAGLGEPQIRKLRAEFKLWADSQRYLSDNARRGLDRDFGLGNSLITVAASLINSFDFESFIRKGTDVDDERSYEITKIVNHVRPLFRFADERAFVVPGTDMAAHGVRHGMHDLTRLNVIRGLVRLLILSFGSDAHIAKMNERYELSGVTDEELEDFYEVAKPLGVDLRFMDPRKEKVGFRAFSEGNLFTFSGDGVRNQNPKNDLLSFYELTEFISIMWSGGQVRDLLYKDILSTCRAKGKADGGSDDFGLTTIDRECFYDVLKDSSSLVHMANLPGVVKAVEFAVHREKPEIYARFKHDLRIISEDACSDPVYISSSEIATLSTVLHYVEVLFTVYDKNQNGLLDAQELMTAFSRFRGYLTEQVRQVVGKSYNEKRLKGIYAFLLIKRRLPDPDDYVDKFNVWRYETSIADYEERGDESDNWGDGFSHTNISKAATESSELGAEAVAAKLPEMHMNRLELLDVLRVLAEVSRATQPFVCEATLSQ